jgi:acetyl-CoA carboxylase biotin carboxyl carrier protein
MSNDECQRNDQMPNDRTSFANLRPYSGLGLASAFFLDSSGLTWMAKPLYLNALRDHAHPPLDLKDIKAIIDLMKKNDLSVFEMEKDGFKLKLQKGPNGLPMLTTPIALAPQLAAAEPATAAASEKLASGLLKDIVSPMVGTFYRAASPDAPSFADVGNEVTEDTVVCIIEAMKVMNEIKAETSGIIAEVVAENGKPVQFGQVLFRVR